MDKSETKSLSAAEYMHARTTESGTISEIFVVDFVTIIFVTGSGTCDRCFLLFDYPLMSRAASCHICIVSSVYVDIHFFCFTQF